MPIEVIMPSLGAVAEESTLLRWLVREGEQVDKGQPVFEAESDKATVEVQAPDRGVVGKLLAKPGDLIPAGEVVAILLAPGEPLAGFHPTQATPPQMPASVPGTSARSPRQPKEPVRATRIIASPVARRIAREKGIALRQVKGTGLGGRIIKADVQEAWERRSATPPLAHPVPGAMPLPLAGIRGTIARRMAESAHTTAAVTLTTEASADALAEFHQALRAEAGEQADAISYDLLMAMIVARGLRRHPQLNASLTQDGIVQHPQINIGVAVDTLRGLLVPVLRDVPRRSPLDLAADLQAKVSRAREGKATPEDLSGGTFTITNLGLFGVDAFTPIINLPECAVLGIGRIRLQPVERQGQLTLGRTVALSLTFDHRIVDGGSAARFLQHVVELTEKPALLLLR